MQISFFINNQPVTVHVDPARNLLDVLRNELGLTGTKQGCDFEGECGACTVLLDGQPVRSCLTPVGKVADRRVFTIEGMGSPDNLHPLQVAFIETGAVQCGYCTPGMLLSAKALLDHEPSPTREQIIEALEGNLCRCTGYTRILTAVELAAARMRGEEVILPPPTSRPIVGKDLTRIEAVEKVTGRTRYVEDISMPGLLYARVFRSPHPHACLLSLDTEKAQRLSGVIRIITAADIPGENSISGYSRDEPLLVPIGGTIKMIGDPIALVVAISPESALAGVEAITAQYQLLPYTVNTAEALQDDALLIHDEGNVLSTYSLAHGDPEAAFARSDVVIETSYRTAYLEHAVLEREAVLAYIDGDGRVTIIGGTHEPHWQREFIAPALGLDPARIQVIVPPVGGSFGRRQDPWPLAATALMAYLLRQSVRLTYTRRESFDASSKRHPYQVNYKIGATSDGRLTGIYLRITANTGAYDSGGYYIPNYAVVAGGGPYHWQAVDAQAQTVYTNGPKAGQMRGYGTPQSVFALECTLDELIAKLRSDPLEFRLKNALTQSSISFLGYPVAESLGYTEVLGAIRPRYLELREEVATFNARPDVYPLRKGLGLAGMWYRFGKMGSLRIEAHAELARDSRFIIYCSAPDYGQGIATVMSQLAAETLGVSRDMIRLVNADTARTPDSDIPGASRATYWVGGAVCKAAQNLKLEIQATAAEILDCPPSDLTIAGERVVSQSSSSKSISLEEIAKEFDRLGKSRRVIGLFDLTPLFPGRNCQEYTPHFVTGAHLAEVIVNLHTGQVQVTRVVAVHDVGRAINPRDAQGQIEGAIVMGLGAALMEEYMPGESTGFSDYYLPTIKSMPEIEVILVEVPSLYGPFGAKGLGEAPILPSTPAIINAISRAIGARIRELPATPERILKAIQRSVYASSGHHEQ
jgi:aldehyde oxidoreductase